MKVVAAAAAVAAVLCLVGDVLGEGDVRSALEVEESDAEDSRRAEKIFAVAVSTSATILATTTISALSTCLSLLDGADACVGRKKRSMSNPMEDIDEIFSNSEMALSGSSDGHDDDEDDNTIKRKVTEDRDGKKLTIWSSSFTTLTITSTSYFAGTTVSATALCLSPGLTAGCFG